MAPNTDIPLIKLNGQFTIAAPMRFSLIWATMLVLLPLIGNKWILDSSNPSAPLKKPALAPVFPGDRETKLAYAPYFQEELGEISE
jgi:hypothetical protein